MRPSTRKVRDRNCIKCEKRQARYADGTCQTCHTLCIAEKIDLTVLAKAKGVPETFLARKTRERKEKVATYNRLVSRGFTQKEIAEKWGMSQRGLAAYMSVSRQRGLKPRSFGKTITTFTEPLPIRYRKRGGINNEHGGGVDGVRNCGCEPCVLKRRASTRERKKKAYKKTEGLRSSDAQSS